jgi:drug/metabolite transporter (DMT)-like permease
MHRRLFAAGLMAPVKAVIQEQGSRYMLAVAFIFAITNPLEKRLVEMSDVFVQAFAYGFGLCLVYFLWARLSGAGFAAALRSNLGWIGLAGLLDAVTLLLQLASYTYIAVVVTISIKRAGIILAVVAGWLFFRERGITDKLIAASVMFCGVLILYLPLTLVQSWAMSAAALAGMCLALYVTRGAASQPAPDPQPGWSGSGPRPGRPA